MANDSTRSRTMARIKGRHTNPELLLRKAIWARGCRYRLHPRIEGCRPDLAFVGHRLVVFIDGCFWHGCPEHYVAPRTNRMFWRRKLRDNVLRDRTQTTTLLEAGWTVIRVWEHEVHQDAHAVASRIIRVLEGRPCRLPAQDRVLQVRWMNRARGIEERTLVPIRGELVSRTVIRPRTTDKGW